MEPDKRDAVVDCVRYWSDRTSLPATRLVGWIGIGRGKFYQRRGRYGKANEHNAWIPRDFWLRPWEREAIVAYCNDHPTEGDVEIIIQRAREKYPEAKPRIISDNGPQFIAKDFKEFIRLCGMTHVRTSPYYPQSNGKIERWHGTIKRECIRPGTPLSLEEARRLIAGYVEHYNTVRLHSAIGYVTPKDKLEGREKEIFAARDSKLEAAREARKKRRHNKIDRGAPAMMN